jgi:hypothetical protein
MSKISRIRASAFSDFSTNGSLMWRAEVYWESGSDEMHLSRTTLKTGKIPHIDSSTALFEAQILLKKMVDVS